jgi:hypothetical protein
LVEKRKTLTTKAQRHQGKIHREVREIREKRLSPRRHKGHKGRNAKKEDARRWIGPSVVCVMRGHKGKILTTEITEDTEERYSPQRRRGTEEVIRGKDARQRHRGHGGKKAMICALFVLALGHP